MRFLAGAPLAAVSLMLALFAAAPCAHAGSYVWTQTDPTTHVTTYSPTYSGGVTTLTPGTSGTNRPFTYSGGSYSGSASGYVQPAPGQSASLLVSATTTAKGAAAPLVAKFTWLPAVPNVPGPERLYAPAPPPGSSVLVQQHCRVDANEMAGLSTSTMQCNDGLGGSTSTQTGGIRQITLEDSKYTAATVAADGTVSVSCSPSGVYNATTTAGSAMGIVSVSYSAAAYPIPINVIGCNSSNQALTGQQITASLNVPSGFTDDAATYRWSIVKAANPPVASADVFNTYTDSATSHPFVAISSYDLAGLHLNFYDKKKETVLVKCNVTLIAPDGTTRIAATAQSQPIAFLKPSLTKSSIINGYVYKDPLIANRWGLLPDPTTSNNEGMVWKDLTVDIPAPFPSGQCCLTQLVTPNREKYTDGVAADLVTNNKVLGLDNKFQVGPPPTGGPDPWTPPATGNDSDSSGIYQITAGDQHFNKITVADSFTVWIMYRPPAATYGGATLNTVWVPLAKSNWGWGCTLQWSNNAWKLAAATPLAPSVKPAYAFSATDDPPDWLVIHTNGH